MTIDLNHLRAMAHSPIENYIVPGVTSWLIGERSSRGCVRMFESARTHEEAIVPHSHRFDFQCVVLAGAVRNVLWQRSVRGDGDLYAKRRIRYGGAPGAYAEEGAPDVHRYDRVERRFLAGDTYSMKADEIHSIFFERDTWVLFLEGPEMCQTTFVLEPWVGGEIVPTFEVRPWMFRRLSATEAA